MESDKMYSNLVSNIEGVLGSYLSNGELSNEVAVIGEQAKIFLRTIKREPYKPNELQTESLIQLKIIRNQNQNKTVVVLPSGAGKTYIPAFDLLSNYHDERLLFITHRNELVSQTVEYFRNILGDKVDIGVFNSSRKDKDARIVVATIQTISRRENLDKFKPDDFQYFVIDEIHHVAAKTYRRVFDYLNFEFFLGLTATPYRYDGQNILELCNSSIAHEVNLKEGIERGFLVPFIYYGLWDDVDYSNIYWNGYKYTEEDLNKLLLIDKRDEAVIREFKAKCADRKAIGFCCSVKHVWRMVEKFTEAGIRCAGITYKEKRDEREKIIDDFKSGYIQIIFTRDIFNEGIDFPDVSALLFLRPTESIVVFIQQLGRGLRQSKGKENVIVLDFIGNYRNAFLIPEWLEGKSLSEIERRRETKPEYEYPLGCEVHFDAKIIDLFERQKKLFLNGHFITDEELRNAYFALKALLGHQPTSTEFNKLSGLSIYLVLKTYRSWNDFLKAMGEPIRHKYRHFRVSDEELTDAYQRLKSDLGRPPTSSEFDKLSRYSSGSVRRRFKTWAKFLKAMGEPFPYKIYKHLRTSDTELTDAYKKLKSDLGRPPTQKEFYRLASYFKNAIERGHFKNWTNFLKSIGETPSKRQGRKKKGVNFGALVKDKRSSTV